MNNRILIATAPLMVALALVGIFVATRWPLWEQSLMSDQSPASWLSSAQLLGASFLALRLGLDHTFNWKLSAWLTIAILLLALDEQFMLHEQWKYGCENWFALCSYAWIRELPMICVAIFGALTILYLARCVPSRDCRRILFASISVGLLALGTDLLDVLRLLSPFEEVIEVSAEALFIGALLIASPDKKQSAALR